MLENTRLGRQFWNVIKVIGIAIAVYLALTLKIGLTGESDDVSKFDYLDNETESIEEILKTDEEMTHGASAAFTNMCVKYSKICDKISWAGSFTDKDKLNKFVYVAYLLTKLDANITRGKDPSDAVLAILINEGKGNRRGSANWTTVTINLGGMVYDNEFFQVISHEMGHIVDLGGLQGTSEQKNPIFTEFNKAVFSVDDPSLEYYKYSWSSEKVRKNGQSREDFCSGYGMSDPFEDFAECHNLYLNHHDYFRLLALNNSTVKEKYNFMSNLYGGRYINNTEAKYEDWETTYRVWDTTKIVDG